MTINENINFTGYVSGIRTLQIDPKLEKWKWRQNFLIWRNHPIFFNVVLFLLSSWVTGPSFMPIPLLVLELWQFIFIRDWPEIQRSEIQLSRFCPISGDCGELGIPNLSQTSLIKRYWMLKNARVTAFTVSESLRENQQGTGLNSAPLPHLD